MHSDAKLLKYTCREGKIEGFGWLLKNGNIYGSKRSMKVIPKKLLDQSVVIEKGMIESISRGFR